MAPITEQNPNSFKGRPRPQVLAAPPENPANAGHPNPVKILILFGVDRKISPFKKE